MKNLSALLCLILLFTLSACHKDPGTVNLRLRPMFGTSDMSLKTVYASADSNNFKFELFKMYISHVKLIRTDNSTVEISPVVYLSSDGPLSMPTVQAPSGSYKGIQFYIGVDSMQDNTDQNYFTNVNPYDPSPLNSGTHDMYWSSALKYVFVKLQGWADHNSNPQHTFLYHVGTNPYYTPVTVLKSFSIADGSQTSLVLNTDIQKIFYGVSSPVNVAVESNTHTDDAPAIAAHFMTNFSNTFSLQ